MAWRVKEDVVVCKLKNRRHVLNILNVHTPKIFTVTNCLGKEKQMPNTVTDYKDPMSGTDCSGKTLSYHLRFRKTLRLYEEAGVHIL